MGVENEPRVPAGSPEGGQWTAEGGTPASMIASGAHQRNVEAYDQAKKHLNPYAPKPQAVAPGTHKAIADKAIQQAEKTLHGGVQEIKDSPEHHTQAGKIAGLSTLAGTRISPDIAARGDLNQATEKILSIGKAGKVYHPEALLAANKITDAQKKLGIL